MRFTEQAIKQVGREASSRPYEYRQILLDSSRTKVASTKSYDIFLSHSSDDEELVIGLSKMLRDQGFSVYVDWIEDPEVDRSQVNGENADMLRERMHRSGALVVAYSTSAAVSPWVTWELAYFDGLKKPVGVLPIEAATANYAASGYPGKEFLQLYPQIGSGYLPGHSGHIYLVEHPDTMKKVALGDWQRGSRVLFG